MLHYDFEKKVLVLIEKFCFSEQQKERPHFPLPRQETQLPIPNHVAPVSSPFSSDYPNTRMEGPISLKHPIIPSIPSNLFIGKRIPSPHAPTRTTFMPGPNRTLPAFKTIQNRAPGSTFVEVFALDGTLTYTLDSNFNLKAQNINAPAPVDHRVAAPIHHRRKNRQYYPMGPIYYPKPNYHYGPSRYPYPYPFPPQSGYPFPPPYYYQNYGPLWNNVVRPEPVVMRNHGVRKKYQHHQSSSTVPSSCSSSEPNSACVVDTNDKGRGRHRTIAVVDPTRSRQPSFSGGICQTGSPESSASGRDTHFGFNPHAAYGRVGAHRAQAPFQVLLVIVHSYRY